MWSFTSWYCSGVAPGASNIIRIAMRAPSVPPDCQKLGSCLTASFARGGSPVRTEMDVREPRASGTGAGMSRWSSFLERAPAGEHAVQIYGRLDELAVVVGAYLDAGLRRGSPALVIATPAHRRAFGVALERRGWSTAELERDVLLVHADAEETLERVLVDGRPSPERFQDAVGELVDAAEAGAPGRTLRAFGEMVDVLWASGRRQAAIELEELWNELVPVRPLALLCAYRLDILDLEVQTDALPDVLRLHSHARAVAEPARFSDAVDRALSEVMAPPRAARIYLDVADRMPHHE